MYAPGRNDHFSTGPIRVPDDVHIVPVAECEGRIYLVAPARRTVYYWSPPGRPAHLVLAAIEEGLAVLDRALRRRRLYLVPSPTPTELIESLAEGSIAEGDGEDVWLRGWTGPRLA